MGVTGESYGAQRASSREGRCVANVLHPGRVNNTSQDAVFRIQGSSDVIRVADGKYDGL